MQHDEKTWPKWTSHRLAEISLVFRAATVQCVSQRREGPEGTTTKTENKHLPENILTPSSRNCSTDFLGMYRPRAMPCKSDQVNRTKSHSEVCFFKVSISLRGWGFQHCFTVNTASVIYRDSLWICISQRLVLSPTSSCPQGVVK